MAILALAGRRIDAPGAPARFPLAALDVVRERLRALLVEREISTLVCSAACGVDLLALEAAGALGLRRRVVLPFAAERFRETSVTDRPGDWAKLYDDVLAALQGCEDLVILEASPAGDSAYAAANAAILDHAEEFVRAGAGDGEHEELFAAIAWDGASRGAGDLTVQFRDLALGRGLLVIELSTLPDP
jgi:hypothetical protein